MAASAKQIGIIGIGSMGGNIARKLYDGGYSLVLYNNTKAAYAPFDGKERVALSESVSDLVQKLRESGNESVVWLMVPGGAVTNNLVLELLSVLKKGDIVIDASNSVYTDSIANYRALKQKEISYLDVGCAGGPSDLLKGVSLMVGGDREAFERTEDIFRTVCGDGTYGYVGGSGTGHITKLAHNMVFYGIFPVMSEGAEFLQAMAREDPKRSLDMAEALRLLAASPPINSGIPTSISQAFKEGLPNDPPPQMAVSDMVKWGADRAAKLGIRMGITNMVLAGYNSMSSESRRIYSAAKKILTGH